MDDEKLLDFSKELSMLKTLYDGKHLTDSEYEQILKSIKAEYGCSIPKSID